MDSLKNSDFFSRLAKFLAAQILFFILVYFFNRYQAQFLMEGSRLWIGGAWILFQLPLSLAGVFVSFWVGKDFFSALQRTTWLGIGLSALLLTFRDPLVALCFERGHFSVYDTQQTAWALAAYALALWPLLSIFLLLQQLGFCRSSKASLWILLGLLPVGGLLAVWMAGRIGATGLALAPSALAFGYALLLFALLRRRGASYPSFRNQLSVCLPAFSGAFLLWAFEGSGWCAKLLTYKSQALSTAFVGGTLLSVFLAALFYTAWVLLFSPS